MTLHYALHQVAVGDSTRSAIGELLHQWRRRPPRERERLRRLAALEEPALDSTHPPTGYRVRLLRERPAETAAVTLAPAENAAIDRELAQAYPRVERKLVTGYRAELWGPT